MKHASPWMVVCVAGWVLGCGGPPEDPPSEVPEGQQDALISQTLIRALPDGTLSQETTFITRAEQRAQIEAREALFRNRGEGVTQQDLDDLAIDGGCAGSSLWLFDQPARRGRQLCLYKQAGAPVAWLDLGTVTRYWDGVRFVRWSGAVRSLWSGVHPGSLMYCTATLCYASPYQNFNANQPMDTLTASASQLNWAYLYDP